MTGTDVRFLGAVLFSILMVALIKLLPSAQWYRRWQGGRWAPATGYLWGHRWVRLDRTHYRVSDEEDWDANLNETTIILTQARRHTQAEVPGPSSAVAKERWSMMAGLEGRVQGPYTWIEEWTDERLDVTFEYAGGRRVVASVPVTGRYDRALEFAARRAAMDRVVLMLRAQPR